MPFLLDWQFFKKEIGNILQNFKKRCTFSIPRGGQIDDDYHIYTKKKMDADILEIHSFGVF